MHLHFSNQITINAPATKVWRVLGHEFANIGQWVSAIPHSQAVTDIPAPDGAEVAGRVCATAVPGFAAVGNTSHITMNRPCASPTRQPTAVPSLSSAPRTTWLYVHSNR